MPRDYFRLDGFAELEKAFRELERLDGPLAQRALRSSLQAAGRPVVKAAKAKARRRTGRLRRAIGAQVVRRRDGLYLFIGPRTKGAQAARHGHLLEFGHQVVRGGRTVGHVPAYPFMRPAWDQEGGDRAFGRLAAALSPEFDRHAERAARKSGMTARPRWRR